MIEAFFLLLAAAQSEAAPAEPETTGAWRSYQLTVREGRKERLAGYGLFTTDSSSLGVIFQCKEGRLSALFATEPTDLGVAITGRAISQRLVGHVEIGGEKLKTRFLSLGKINLAAPMDASVARKIYNAVVRDEIIRIRIGIGKDLEYDLPPPDAAEFNRLAETCNLGAAG